MRRALDLAEIVIGGLAPRPPVGAVIVAADGDNIVGEGATEPNPGLHAEAVAIAMAKDRSRGATMYCTLEPHQNPSTTPPCTQAIIDAGIKRVICPTMDPNPKVHGQGFKHLRSAGIEIINKVDEVSQRRADETIEGFAKHIRTGLPFVTVKWAMSLDGKIATRERDSKWITSNPARAHAHKLRYRSDAVMTGIGTVIADDPRLTARDLNTGKRICGRPYIRVIIDSHNRMYPSATILSEDGEVLQAIARNSCTSSHTAEVSDTALVRPESGVTKGQRQGHPWQTILLPNTDNESVDLTALLRYLGERGCHNVLVEAGEKLTGSLFDLKLVDKVVAYIATDKIIGGVSALSPIGGQGQAKISESVHLHSIRIEHLGDDLAIIGYIDYS